MKLTRWMAGVTIACAFAVTACGSDPDPVGAPSTSAPSGTDPQTATTGAPGSTPESQAPAGGRTGRSRITTFPASFDQMVRYGDYRRGSGGEAAFALQETIDIAKAGRPLPPGTRLVLEIYNNNRLTEYFVMEKGANWGQDYPEDVRTGDWHFQQFSPNRQVSSESNPARCMSCHGGQRSSDFLFTTDRMQRYMP